MKSIIAVTLLLITISCKEAPNDPQIEELVLTFVQAGDENDVSKLDKILHPEFRALANRVFDSDELQVLTKEVYLSLIQKGTIGGDKRKVVINNMSIRGNNAMVDATFSGQDHIFKTYMLLVRDVNNSWMIVSDLPEVEKLY